MLAEANIFERGAITLRGTDWRMRSMRGLEVPTEASGARRSDELVGSVEAPVSVTEWAVQVHNISAAYDGPLVLVDVNLTLPPGESVAIIGPNGGGKSTLSKVILGLLRPRTGEVRIFGETIATQRVRSRIAYVPQEDGLDRNFPISVWDVVLTGRYGHMRAAGGWRRFLPPRWSGEEHHEAVEKALDAVEMLPFAKRPIGALSGGQRKRVFVARALAQDPALFVLDEPMAGVDRRSEELIYAVLRKARDEGRTVLMVTHDLPDIEHFADRVVLVQRTIVAEGTPAEVLTEEHLARAYGARFVRL